MGRPTVSVIIPTLNAEEEIGGLLDALEGQSVRPDEVLVVDSSSDDETAGVVLSHPSARLEVIDRADFDHGGTRDMAVGMTSGELVLFLTQDALPGDRRYIENLTAPFSDPAVALAYGRQVPKPGARRYVRLVQEFNYPAESAVRTAADIGRLGIKAYFCSDVCSAYRRSALEAIGGIPHPCSTNEDMLACCRLIKSGKSVCYAAEAFVAHSHNLSLRQQYYRNKMIGCFLAEHGGELAIPSEVQVGGKIVLGVAKKMIADFQLIETVRFGADCIARLMGNRIGRLEKNRSLQ